MSEQHPDIGEISKLGQRYLDGQLRGSQLTGSFTLSRADDIPTVESMSAKRLEELRRIGLEQLPGRVAFGVLAAGASSRMALSDLPDACREMLEEAGQTDLPTSKALVPVYSDPRTGPLNFLDLFLRNVHQFRVRHAIDNPALLLSSAANGDEIDLHLRKVDAQQVLTFRQPLAPQIAATADDIQRASKNFASDDTLDQAARRSACWAGREVLIGKPAGHGEFLHQLVESGTLSELSRRGIEFLSVRNIDNAAALLDDTWLSLLGYAIEQQLDCLLEVCPRLDGQKGGALIRQREQWRIAEDPSFHSTPHSATESCYINNAVALFRLDYFYKLYETAPAELQSASPQRLAEIADQGRRKFPVIVEAKPVVLRDGSVVGAVTPETNLWESTGVVSDVRIGAVGVPSEQSVGADFLDQPAETRSIAAQRVRFSPTKTWDDYNDAVKRAILVGIVDKLLNDH